MASTSIRDCPAAQSQNSKTRRSTCPERHCNFTCISYTSLCHS